MKKANCLRCYHFPVCQVHIKARQIELWKKDTVKFFQKEAQGCDYYEYKEVKPPK